MTIYTAKEDFSKLFAKPEWCAADLKLDLSGIVEIDTSGAQLLVLFAHAVAEEKSIKLTKISDSADSVLNLLNLKKILTQEDVAV
ncbi:STAS domain-containing protein [Oceanicoccus sp. KOV_DT_Chl]|uniref:STAS domain-containing protein n=1 Tax=Oceanicoccus sp. KOV_DT_Chl TaxID=1904639 RepID=UPI000C7A8D69|nr:STAS domain-containing protein [Oceanicoccus sp. KOV_DT_Chl]